MPDLDPVARGHQLDSAMGRFLQTLTMPIPRGKSTPESEGVRVCGALSETVASAPVATLTARGMYVDASFWKLN